ncbi:hypothetical protein U1737_07535 [Sphingomonas sp. LB3N6]|uniref:hypothetical protein n=1 Tax=Sphingomonas fucosidasi TaxID=3096164 RepID=UPI002FCA5D63
MLDAIDHRDRRARHRRELVRLYASAASTLEYEAAVDDFVDLGGNEIISKVDAYMLYEHRNEAAKLPTATPRGDRSTQGTARVKKHEATSPKCAAPSHKPVELAAAISHSSAHAIEIEQGNRRVVAAV